MTQRAVDSFWLVAATHLAKRWKGTQRASERNIGAPCSLSGSAGKIMSSARLSVFLVEDELLIRMMVADMLKDLGHHVVAEAGDISQAVELAQSTAFDLAILDINLHGKASYPVADIIKARQIPFIFASGYEAMMAPGDYLSRMALQKPYSLDKLKSAIDRAMR
jgi:CheY-like chemotaxis protein